MIIEKTKRPIVPTSSPLHLSLFPLEAWGDSRHVEFPGGNFLEWILDKGLVMADDCSLLEMLGWGVLSAFHEAWTTGHYDPDLFDRRSPAWLRLGNYRIYISPDGYSMTVQQGRRYGRFIDCHNFEGDWLELRDALQEIGVTVAPMPASKGRIAAGLVQEYVQPLDASIPSEVNALAWQSCKGSRMEAIALGSFEGTAYDISSAFPFAAANLPWAEGDWIESREYRPDAPYGFAVIDADIPSELPAGPVALRVSDNHQDDLGLQFPVGKIRITASQPEMSLLTDMGVKFKIRKGWWGYPRVQLYPFESLMGALWELRQYHKEGGKALSVACVGQIGSVQDDGGPCYYPRAFFNAVYFSHIYADTRCRIYRKALEFGIDHVMGYTIDGLITDSMQSVMSDESDFGEWRMESQGRFFVANDYFKDRPGDDGRWRRAVEETPDDVPQEKFRATLQNYVGLRLGMDREEYRSKLGCLVDVSEDLPLGSEHRGMPPKIQRQDYLAGAIFTHLP